MTIQEIADGGIERLEHTNTILTIVLLLLLTLAAGLFLMFQEERRKRKQLEKDRIPLFPIMKRGRISPDGYFGEGEDPPDVHVTDWALDRFTMVKGAP